MWHFRGPVGGDGRHLIGQARLCGHVGERVNGPVSPDVLHRDLEEREPRPLVEVEIPYVFFDRYRGADFPKTFHPFTKTM